MGDLVNEVDLVEEYENENSVGISLVEAISDNDRDIAQNSQALNTVSTEGPFTEVQTRRVLKFCNVSPPHTGLLIADTLEKYFQNWGIDNKISSITIDNASSNGVAIRILKDDFRLKKTLSVNGQLFHVRCCAHITNLLVQYRLGVIRDIVDCVKDGIKYLITSDSRLKQFSEIAKQLQLPSKKLILDVPTRWSSTYLMLDAAI
ncbi:zinc finger BED domain-containing protein RICESLEEPER 2-like [Carya illinoinensis]|uniref:zinc finger BED domain-containing protein RICESLEEPER 2-like n=1 Tax=Carya illinoinensis TaxID=32201 RepID=UPI001C72594E|nr:zinc finger BED domain-containing protein RICESLEEPER 2-like [Carya illinoinensis]